MTALDKRLRDPERFRASVRSFDWLGEAVTGATDVDCLIERRGSFLVLEGKTWHPDGVHVPIGQHIALTALARLTTRQVQGRWPLSEQLRPSPFTVYLVGEIDGETYKAMQYGRPAPLTETKRGAFFPATLFDTYDRDGMRNLVSVWKARAES